MKWFAYAVAGFCFAACSPAADKAKTPQGGPGVTLIGRIAHPRITESSGAVASRKHSGVIWTHNDGGGKRQVLYAMNRTGQPLAEFRITGASLDDWESLASDNEGNLYLGDTGNNDRQRQEIAVHQLEEPDPSRRNGIGRVSRTWRLNFPGAPFDCEGLFIWNESGYVISKVTNDERAGLYRFSLTNTGPQTLEMLGQLRIDSPVTDAALSADGQVLAVLAKNGAYAARIDGDPTAATRGKLVQTKFKHDHIEACTFVPEGLLVTAESREIFLFTDAPFHTGAAVAQEAD